jgi:DNA helicase II / ATP-dependent DNA helicase PcrA
MPQSFPPLWSVSLMQYEENLDPEQRKAVEAKERAIAVLAGPGSGKTRVLSYRARYLLSKDKNSNALLLTFTNKAASEMKSRAIAVTPGLSKRIRAGTFHNFALAVLRSHGSHVGIAQDFDVLDEQEQGDLASEIAAQVGDHRRAYSEQRLRRRVHTSEVAKFAALFDAAKRKAGVVDFDDLIVSVAQLFRQKPEIAKAYATKYQHILIDEFQDTNAAQFEVVRALVEQSAPTSTISVFADDDQAIFGFAGAESKNIARFCGDLQATEYPLTTNYRCTEQIVKCANRLILANRSDGREMKAVKKNGVVSTRIFLNVAEEAAELCDEIEQKLAAGTAPHAISILVRNGTRADAIKAAMSQRGIPFSNWLAAAYNSRETRQVRLCLSLVRPVLTNRVARQVCDMLGIGPAPSTETINTEQFLNVHASRTGVSQLLEIRRLADKGGKVSDVVRQVGACIEALNPNVQITEALLAEVAAFETHDPDYSLDHLLADLALGGKGGAPTEGGGVKLATIHRTKGLQWPHVYLVGLEQDSLPHYYTRTPEQMQEERRLCFVGVCRAEDSLTITRIREYRGYKKAPSPFIAELGLSES